MTITSLNTSLDQVVLLRVFDQHQQLIAVVPHLSEEHFFLGVLLAITTPDALIGREQVYAVSQRLQESLCSPEIKALAERIFHEVETQGPVSLQWVTHQTLNLLSELHRAPSQQISEAFFELLDQGLVRAAEKIRGVWTPQPYVIHGILSYFSTHSNHRTTSDSWDKIPVKNHSYGDEAFDSSGVRYVPGTIVRAGSYVGPQTVLMSHSFVNTGAYIAGHGTMIDVAARVASCAQIGKGVKFGAGSGIEGVLEPAGRMPSVVEDFVKIGAMCEVTGIISEGSVIASGVVMASGKKIFDEETQKLVPPILCPVGDQTFLLPFIPPYRLAVGGSLWDDQGRFATDAVILKPGDLRETKTLKHFQQQGVLYR